MTSSTARKMGETVMNRTEYEKLCRQLDAEVDALRRKRDALDTVYQLFNGTPSKWSHGATRQAIEPIIESLSGCFGVSEIVAQLPYLHRCTISGWLGKLAKEGRLELVDRGSGRRPSTYRMMVKE